NVTYSLIWAFVLSSIIAITHKVTFTGHQYPKNFFQALALGSIVSAMVMMAIGDSLARGLGAFGALAIIRFRTRIQDARNILFIFAALSVGLAIGIFGYTIAFAGTIIYCTMALILHFTPFSTKTGMRGLLLFRLNDSDPTKLAEVTGVIGKYCADFHDVEVTSRNSGRFDYEYEIEMNLDADNTAFLTELQKIESITRVRVTFKNIQETN
ncbi:MAG TPA: DUF4956 domain-containing protein, partial [Balneola sp.]|nr:DUF4956 domain-containing protein [Balneola sp.]